MAAQLETDVATLFLEPRARAAVDIGKLAREDAPIPTWRYALWQAETGLVDPRPRFAVATKPPDDVRISALRPGMLLEGRVTRAVPFGVFVDVGLGAEALIPLPHIGDHPGIDPATIAPVGAVVQARVFEVDPVKRRLTLSMRSDRELSRPPARAREGGGRRDDRRPGVGGERPSVPAGAGARTGSRPPSSGPAGDRPAGGRSGGPPRPAREPARAPDRREGRGQSTGGGSGKPGGSGFRDRATSAGAGGGFSKGGGGRRDEGRRFDRDDPGAPRRISLPMDSDSVEPVEATDGEPQALSPMAELARKLEELKRRIARPD